MNFYFIHWQLILIYLFILLMCSDVTVKLCESSEMWYRIVMLGYLCLNLSKSLGSPKKDYRFAVLEMSNSRSCN
jgi:hypothetical protein